MCLTVSCSASERAVATERGADHDFTDVGNLSLRSSISFRLSSPTPSQSITCLTLTGDREPGPRFLRYLLPSTNCRVRSLRLVFGSPSFTEEFIDHLASIKANITSLTLDFTEAAPNLPCVRQIVPLFTHISSLTITCDSLTEAFYVLDLVTPQLTTLEFTSWSKRQRNLSADKSLKLLVEAAEFQQVKKLKRWRVDRKLEVDMSEGEGAKWKDGCEARGIEVRDEKRYFTGTSRLLWVFALSLSILSLTD